MVWCDVVYQRAGREEFRCEGWVEVIVCIGNLEHIQEVDAHCAEVSPARRCTL